MDEESEVDQDHLYEDNGDQELRAYFLVFKKLSLPCNHIEISWCLRQPDSLPN